VSLTPGEALESILLGTVVGLVLVLSWMVGQSIAHAWRRWTWNAPRREWSRELRRMSRARRRAQRQR
jgi:hypothetical protein